MNATKWSFEVPLAHLDTFHEDQDFIFALQHLCTEEKYKQYLKKSEKFIILDNSSNELVTPCSIEALIHTAKEVNANAIIAPDMDEWSEEKCCQEWQKAQVQAGAIPTFGVFRNRKEKKHLDFLGCTYFTIPYEYRFLLPLYGTYSKVHFLGLNNPLEVRVFHPASVDTGMPIKLALQGLTIQDWLMKACPHIHSVDNPDYFKKEMTDEEIQLAKKNIRDIKEMCSRE